MFTIRTVILFAFETSLYHPIGLVCLIASIFWFELITTKKCIKFNNEKMNLLKSCLFNKKKKRKSTGLGEFVCMHGRRSNTVD